MINRDKLDDMAGPPCLDFHPIIARPWEAAGFARGKPGAGAGAARRRRLAAAVRAV
jgi:hypothetical protein